MSRRCHHGSPRHARAGHGRRRPGTTDVDRRSDQAAEPIASPPPAVPADIPSGPVRRPRANGADVAVDAHPAEPLGAGRPGLAPSFAERPRTERAPAENGGPDHARADHGATAPQLRRFIKSRAYVPMHELRRRFGINGGEDDVTVVDIDEHRIYVGLPEREGELLGELLRGGDIGYELSLDPISPIVVGVYPMRPVSRA